MNESTIRQQFQKIVNTLIAEQITIATMESCTGGLIASLLTDTEGASAIFPGGMVTYSNEAKIKAGVPAEIIASHGVYSLETAEAMALACRAAFATNLGLGVTGSLGRVDPSNGDSVPGEVYLALIGDSMQREKIILPKANTRSEYKLLVAEAVGRMLTKELFSK